MFVFNDCTTDARVLREAGSLASAGHDVTIFARPRDLASEVTEREQRDGFTIVRVPIPSEWRIWWIALRNPWRARGYVKRLLLENLRRFPGGWFKLAGLAVGGLIGTPFILVRGLLALVRGRGRRSARPGGGTVEYLGRWAFSTLGWARAAAMAAPVADVYHGHDLTGLPAAIFAQGRVGGVVVYDSHEIFMESGGNVSRPWPVRLLFRRLEARWVARSAALVTVNRSLAIELDRRFHPRRILVVHNCAPCWDPPDIAPDLIRDATGIPAGGPIALYHGGFSLHRGIEQLAAAILEPGLERAHAVCLGYGSRRDALDAMAADPRYSGRFHVLDAVPPAELLPWVASADVGVMPIQPSTLNHLLSTPNKLFESLAAGVPVVASDFPEMRAIVTGDPSGPLGELCRPDDVADVARAIKAIVDLPPEGRADLRRRCLEAAHARWNWENEVAGLLALYEDLAPAA
jgi:glycosyltransferase involved in cell wall biosynthesis